jgi:hypothetical protein
VSCSHFCLLFKNFNNSLNPRKRRRIHEIAIPITEPYLLLEKLAGSIHSKKKLPNENKNRAIPANMKIQA